jgi:hypothetical protein
MYPDGAEYLSVITASGKGATGTYTGHNFATTNDDEWIQLDPPWTLPYPMWLASEVLLNEDLTDDGIIGDEITDVIDAADGNDAPFAGLYKMKSDAYVIGVSGLVEGNTPTQEANAVLASKDGKVWSTKAKAVAITPFESEDEALIDYGVITSVGVGSTAKFSEEIFTWNFIGPRAVSKGSAVTLTLSQLLAKELVYDQDLNGDTAVGDSVTTVLDSQDSSLTYGLYKMASGIFAVSEQSLALGAVPESATSLLANSKGAAWTTKATPIAVNAQTNAKTDADELTIVSVTGSGSKKVYAEELFTVSTDGSKATLTGKAVTLTLSQLLAKELVYDQDLNGDGFTGDNSVAEMSLKLVGVGDMSS